MKREKTTWAGLALATAVVALDRISKELIQADTDIAPGFFRIRRTMNSGMAFSMLNDHPALLSVMTLAVILALALWLVLRPKEGTRLLRGGMWLVIGGGLGNWIDRALYGAVVDFIEPTFVRFAVFNVADIAVCVGVGLAILGVLMSNAGGEKK